MTGELRRERPSLSDEVEWGLQFFRDSIYDAVLQLFERFTAAIDRLTGGKGDATPCIRFHSWIGGDRDGNPNVTAEVTRDAVDRARQTVLDRYLAALISASAKVSISSLIARLPAEPESRLRAIIRRSPEAATLEKRNPSEIFRQALTAMAGRIRATSGRDATGYRMAADFITDLRSIEEALTQIGAQRIAHRRIRPIRWQAQAFGFRTFTLDIRQNSTVTTAVLAEI